MFMKRSLRVWLCFILLVGILCSAAGLAKVNYNYHSLYIYNFTKYIQWPDVTREMIIGVAGGDPDIMEAFEKMAMAKSSQELRYYIRKIQSPADIAACHILYIPEAESNKTAFFLARAKGSKLIVTEGKDMLRQGGMINFVMVDRKLRFEINQEALDKAGLKVSSQLKVMAVH